MYWGYHIADTLNIYNDYTTYYLNNGYMHLQEEEEEEELQSLKVFTFACIW